MSRVDVRDWLLTPEEREELISEAGLDQPMIVQYFRYWGNVLTFNFGTSFRMNEAIGDLILERLPWTLLITMTALLLSSLIGIALGVLAAWRRGRASDVVSLNTMIALDSTPSFWLGMLFVALFSVTLGWLPSSGYVGLTEDPVEWARHLVLPAVVVGTVSGAVLTRFVRSSALEALGEDYTRTARAKGLPRRVVIGRHVLRNALVPVVTVAGMQAGALVGGAVVIETVFAWPGLGRLTFEAVLQRDYPVLLGIFLILSVIVIALNLVTDLIYRLIDPRMTTEAA